MPSVILPFAEPPNSRAFFDGTSTKDQRIISALLTPYKNGMYVEKRPGWRTQNTISGASGDMGHFKYTSPSTFAKLTVFTNGSVFDIYHNDTSVGTVTQDVQGITEIIIGTTTYYLIAVEGTDQGWYLAQDAKDQTSYTGNRTSGSPIITSIASTAGMYSGQLITGTGIPAGTRILTVDSGTQITLNANATSGAGTPTTLTKEPIANILDSDYPDDAVGQFVVIDGFIFRMTSTGAIKNSNLNSVTSWDALDNIQSLISTDSGVTLAKYKNYLLAFGTNSVEVFENAGHPRGSPLARLAEHVFRVGIDFIATQVPLVSSGDIICWKGGMDGNTNHNGIYTVVDLKPKKISTPFIDRVFAYYETIYLHVYTFEGQTYLYMAVHDDDDTFLKHFVYSFTTDMWTEAGFPFSMVISPDLNAVSALARNDTNGRVYAFGADAVSVGAYAYTDVSSTSYTMTIQMDKWDGGTNKRKFLDRIELLGSDIQSSGTTTLEISYDDYATWTTLGTFDNTVIDPYIVNAGSFVGAAAFRVTHSAATAWRAKGLKIYYRFAKASQENES